MKIEKISDTQIRCTLTSDDLSVRNLDIRELAYGSEKAKNLFSEMMLKASSELGFEAEGTPIMIEAIPSQDKGIVLLITKVDDPEEVDMRFANFTPTPEGEKSLMERLFNLIQENVPVVSDAQKSLVQNNNNIIRGFTFDSLDAVIEAAKALNGDFDGHNSLYKDNRTKEYYLILKDVGSNEQVYNSTCNMLAEYATNGGVANANGVSYLYEHYEVIIAEDALNKLVRI